LTMIVQHTYVVPSRKLNDEICTGRRKDQTVTRRTDVDLMMSSQSDRIDVHHHFFPPSLSRVKAAQSQAVGFRTPPENLPWNADLSLRAMDSLGIQLAILSLPAGLAESFDEAKRMNAQMHEIVLQHQGRFAFWGCLGDWRDVEGRYLLNRPIIASPTSFCRCTPAYPICIR
jgi:hypothetical protein